MGMVDFDYNEIISYYNSCLTYISNYLWLNNEKVYYDNYSNLEKARDILNRVVELSDYNGEDDWWEFVLGCLCTARLKIGYCVACDIVGLYSFDYKKYDDIVLGNECSRDIFRKYSFIDYRRVAINIGLMESIGDLRELIDDSVDLSDEEKSCENGILDEIEGLVRSLRDFSEK